MLVCTTSFNSSTRKRVLNIYNCLQNILYLQNFNPTLCIGFHNGFRNVLELKACALCICINLIKITFRMSLINKAVCFFHSNPT